MHSFYLWSMFSFSIMKVLFYILSTPSRNMSFFFFCYFFQHFMQAHCINIVLQFSYLCTFLVEPFIFCLSAFVSNFYLIFYFLYYFLALFTVSFRSAWSFNLSSTTYFLVSLLLKRSYSLILLELSLRLFTLNYR